MLVPWRVNGMPFFQPKSQVDDRLHVKEDCCLETHGEIGALLGDQILI